MTEEEQRSEFSSLCRFYRLTCPPGQSASACSQTAEDKCLTRFKKCRKLPHSKVDRDWFRTLLMSFWPVALLSLLSRIALLPADPVGLAPEGWGLHQGQGWPDLLHSDAAAAGGAYLQRVFHSHQREAGFGPETQPHTDWWYTISKHIHLLAEARCLEDSDLSSICNNLHCLPWGARGSVTCRARWSCGASGACLLSGPPYVQRGGTIIGWMGGIPDNNFWWPWQTKHIHGHLKSRKTRGKAFLAGWLSRWIFKLCHFVKLNWILNWNFSVYRCLSSPVRRVLGTSAAGGVSEFNLCIAL